MMPVLTPTSVTSLWPVSPLVGKGGGGVDPAVVFATLQSDLTTAGIWSGLDALYINGGVALANAVINLKSPGTFNLTPTGSPTLSGAGFSGDGVGAYLSTGYTPAGTLNYKKDSASAGVWVTRQDVSSTGDFVLGAASGDTLRIAPKVGVNGARTRLNCSGSNDIYTIKATGLIALRRNNASDYQVFKDGSPMGTVAVASTSLPTGIITVLRTATSYSPSTTTVAAEFLGRSLTDTEMGAMWTALGKALISLGVVSSDDVYFPPGATTWFNDPRSIAVTGGVLVGGVHPTDGSIIANTIVDGQGGRQAIIAAKFEIDDHDDEAFLERASDSRILTFFSQHTGTNYSVALSTNPRDGSAWGTVTNISASLGGSLFSYANPVQLTGEVGSPVHLFLRCKTGVEEYTMHRAILDENGAVVTPVVRILGGLRPYFKVAQNSTTRVDFFCNDSNPNTAPTNSTYHFYYEGGSWFTSFGVNLGSPPFLPADVLTKVFDGSTAAGISWVWNAEVIAGNPSIVFAVFPTVTDHRYYRGTFVSGAWAVEQICTAGGAVDNPSATNYSQGYYSGGVCFDPLDVNIVYCSRQVDGSGAINPVNGVHQIFKYVRTAGIWVSSQLTYSPTSCFRPFVIPTTRKLQYVTGSYTDYTTFNTRIKLLTIS